MFVIIPNPVKKVIRTFFIFLSSGFISGIVFYYLIVIPLLGGRGGVYVRATGLKDSPYIVGEELVIEGIITNTQKNSSSFIISAALTPSEKNIESIKSRKKSDSLNFAGSSNDINQFLRNIGRMIIEGRHLSDNYLLSELKSESLQTKNYFLNGGESRRFSFKIPTSDNSVREGRWFLNLLVLKPSYSGLALFGKDEVVFSKVYNIAFVRSSTDLARYRPDNASINNLAVSSSTSLDTGHFGKPGVTAAKTSQLPKTRIAPKIVEEEIISADFKVDFSDERRLKYNQTLLIPAYIRNESSTQEQFEIFLKIISPDGSKRTVSRTVSLLPSEEKRLDFIYKITSGHSEGEYNFSLWYKTKQAMSEEVFDATFTLLDEEPQIRVKKMLINPLAGRPTEIVVEVIDDIGVREVFLVATPLKLSGERGESRNIPMGLVEGDYLKGLWRCEYIPQKSDAYEFSFVAIDTKRQRGKTGAFPIKVRQ